MSWTKAFIYNQTYVNSKHGSMPNIDCSCKEFSCQYSGCVMTNTSYEWAHVIVSKPFLLQVISLELQVKCTSELLKNKCYWLWITLVSEFMKKSEVDEFSQNSFYSTTFTVFFVQVKWVEICKLIYTNKYYRSA